MEPFGTYEKRFTGPEREIVLFFLSNRFILIYFYIDRTVFEK